MTSDALKPKLPELQHREVPDLLKAYSIGADDHNNSQLPRAPH